MGELVFCGCSVGARDWEDWEDWEDREGLEAIERHSRALGSNWEGGLRQVSVTAWLAASVLQPPKR